MAFNISTSRQVGPDLEILAHITGNEDVAESIVLDASTFPLNADGERELLAGTPLVKNENNQYQAYSTVNTQRAQTVSIVASGGTFTLTHSAQTTGNIAYNASADAVAAALIALSTISANGVDVQRTGSGTAADPYVYHIAFLVDAEAAAITATGTNLTGSGAAATVSSAGSTGILGILNHTERVPDNLAHSDVVSAMWNFGQWFRTDRIVGWASNQAAIKAALPNCKFS